MKICTKCGAEKDFDQFYKQAKGKGYRGACKSCLDEARRKRYKKSYKGGMGHNQGRVELPSADLLNELFMIDGPNLVRKVARGRCTAGEVVGKVRKDGYSRVWVEGAHALVHRVVWKMRTGQEPPKYLDHINGDRSDNRFENLREADHFMNMWNRSEHKLNTSGFTGIRWHDYESNRSRPSWVVKLGFEGKVIHVGYFSDIKDALRAFEKAVIENHGDFGKRKIEHNRKMAKAMGIDF